MSGLLILAPRSDAMMQQGHITIRVLENGDRIDDPHNAPLVGWGVWVGPLGSYGTDGHPTDENGQWTFNVMPGLYDTGYMMGMAPYDYPPFQSVSVGPNESVTVTYVLTRLHFDPTVEVISPNPLYPEPWGNWHGVDVRLTWVMSICEPLHLRVGYEEFHTGLNHEGMLLKQEGTFFDGDTSSLDLMNHVVETFTGPGGRQGYIAELDFPWDTTWCYNNLYKVLADGVFNDFWHPSPPGAGIKAGDEKPVTLRNVVAKDVAATPGTSDVLYFDPNAPELDPLRAPQIGFTVEDEGDMRGPYTWKLYLRKLVDGNWEAGDHAVISGDAAAPGAVSAVVNSPAEGQTQDNTLTAKGVYAFDVVVQEWGPQSMPGGGGGEWVVVDEHWAK
ncbi:MAG: hypothetical protein HYU66_09850, partial [Armatimonadetes bacterium]|nr:hypothetical protein [Armatimonadota bacterium]